MAPKTKDAGAAPQSRATGPTAGNAETFFPGAWLVGSYLVLSLLFFLPALLPGMQIFGTDYLAVAYFWEQFVTERFAAGELPQWLPYVYGGAPFFANPMDTYYPVTLLLRLIGVPTHHHLALIFVVNYFLAGTGTYLLLREMGARRLPAYLSGLLYMFAGYLISYIYGGHDGRAIVATLAPLFLFALHGGLRSGGLRWFVLGGAVLGSALLSFQIQSAYYLLLAGGLWSAFLLWHLRVYRPLPALGRRLGGGALTLVIGFALAAVNFLPFLDYVPASPRGGEGGRGYAYSTSWSMPPAEIVGLAVPERSGLLDAYVGDNPFKLHTEYSGALTILLLLTGAYLLRRNRYHWFFAGLGIFALTIAFGGHTPVYRLYYALLPGTAKFRAPSIAFFLVTLALAVIAGLALERLAALRAQAATRSGRERADADAELHTARNIGLGALGLVALWGIVAAAAPGAASAARAASGHPAYALGVWRFAVFLALAAGGVWLWVRGTLSTRVAGLLLAAISVADLWVIGKKFFETVPAPQVLFAPDEVATFLRAQPEPFRTFVLFDLPQDNYYNLFGAELVGGEHGNQLQSYNEFLGAGEETYTDFHNMGSPAFLALANAKYLVTTQQIGAPFLQPVFRGRVRDGRVAIVYENTSVLPRAFVVPSAVTVEGRDAALAHMRQQDFDPSREVVLYEEAPIAPATEGTVRGEARITRHEPSEVVVQVSATDSAYLVLTDNYYKDWIAEVDGEPAPILRAYHTFRAVPIPGGEHSVTFRFESRQLWLGFRVTAAVWAALLLFGAAVAFRAWRVRRAAEPAA